MIADLHATIRCASSQAREHLEAARHPAGRGASARPGSSAAGRPGQRLRELPLAVRRAPRDAEGAAGGTGEGGALGALLVSSTSSSSPRSTPRGPSAATSIPCSVKPSWSSRTSRTITALRPWRCTPQMPWRRRCAASVWRSSIASRAVSISARPRRRSTRRCVRWPDAVSHTSRSLTCSGATWPRTPTQCPSCRTGSTGGSFPSPMRVSRRSAAPRSVPCCGRSLADTFTSRMRRGRPLSDGGRFLCRPGLARLGSPCAARMSGRLSATACHPPPVAGRLRSSSRSRSTRRTTTFNPATYTSPVEQVSGELKHPLPLENGPYEVRVSAADEHGNVSDPAVEELD
jgi:hypothetical protein